MPSSVSLCFTDCCCTITGACDVLLLGTDRSRNPAIYKRYLKGVRSHDLDGQFTSPFPRNNSTITSRAVRLMAPSCRKETSLTSTLSIVALNNYIPVAFALFYDFHHSLNHVCHYFPTIMSTFQEILSTAWPFKVLLTDLTLVGRSFSHLFSPVRDTFP